MTLTETAATSLPAITIMQLESMFGLLLRSLPNFGNLPQLQP